MRSKTPPLVAATLLLLGYAPLECGAGASRPVAGLCLDLGPPGSPVREGCEALGTATAAPGPFGAAWKNGASLSAGDQNPSAFHAREGQETLIADVFLDELTRDWVEGAGPATLSLPVQNGEWGVALVVGRAERGGGAPFTTAGVKLEGEDVGFIGLARPLAFSVTELETTVRDGNLDLTLEPAPFPWRLAAVLVYPLPESPETTRTISDLRAAIDFLPADLREGWREVSPTEEPWAGFTPEDRARGYVLFGRSYLEEVWPGSRPRPGWSPPILVLRASPGEEEPVAFALLPAKTLIDVRVEVREAPLPVEVHRVAYSPMRARGGSVRRGQGHGSPGGLYLRVPDRLLAATDPVDLSEGEATRYLVTLRVPADTTPGRYRATLAIRGEGIPEAELALDIEVLPIRLDEPGIDYGAWWRPPVERLRPPTHEADWSARLVHETRLAVLDQQRHGLYSPRPAVAVSRRGDELQVDLEGLADVMRIRAEEGVRRAVELVEVRRRAEGWPPLVYLLFDEPPPRPGVVRFVARLYQAARSVEGVRTSITITKAMRESPESWRQLDPLVDVRTYALGHDYAGFHDETTFQREVEASGDVFEVYFNDATCNSYGEPARTRYLWGLWAWKMGLDGVATYAYEASIGNPENHLDGRGKDRGLVIPSWEGPVRTDFYEGTREGIDDVRYLRTLERGIRKGLASGYPARVTTAREAEDWIVRLRAELPTRLEFLQRFLTTDLPDTAYLARYERSLGVSVPSDGFAVRWPSTRMEEIRREVAQRIMALEAVAR